MSTPSRERFSRVDLRTASDAQRRVADEMRAGPRKAVIGPFIPLLHAPELASRIQKVGEYLRFGSSLPKDVLECAILVVSRRWRCDFEWSVHSKLALAAGMPAAVVDAIGQDAEPKTLPEPYALVVGLCRAALDSGDIGDAFFQDASSTYGQAGVLELLTLCGYYSTLAMFLNTARLEADA